MTFYWRKIIPAFIKDPEHTSETEQVPTRALTHTPVKGLAKN